MYRDILLIIICVTIRSKLGPIGLATAASANNFLGKNKNLTRTSFIVTAECPPCLRGTKWCNLQCVCICVQWGVILWDETVVFSFNFPHLTYLLRNQIIYSSEYPMVRKVFKRERDKRRLQNSIELDSVGPRASSS